MRYFKAYIRENMKWIVSVLSSGMAMAAFMYLNQIAVSEIAYGLFVCGTFTAVVTGTGFYRYYHCCRELERLEKVITVSTAGLHPPQYLYEVQYQACLRLLEQEKDRLENEMYARQQDMDTYYSMWVHQIKTPIAALKLLLDEEECAEEIISDTAKKQQELFKIEQYVDMALQYSRIGSPSNDFVIQKICIDDVIRAAIHKYAGQFVHKKLSLHYEPSPFTALTDGKWLGFVVGQLLANAIKYTNTGGITILTGCETQKEESCQIIRIAIKDTGIGISAEDLPRVCERGYTGYNGRASRSADRQSTGIGLYLCRQVLDKLGHPLVITSTEGVGTQVEIRMKSSSNLWNDRACEKYF